MACFVECIIDMFKIYSFLGGFNSSMSTSLSKYTTQFMLLCTAMTLTVLDNDETSSDSDDEWSPSQQRSPKIRSSPSSKRKTRTGTYFYYIYCRHRVIPALCQLTNDSTLPTYCNMMQQFVSRCLPVRGLNRG